MRFPTLLTCGLVLVASAANAQDLQYRMRIRASMPDMPTPMPTTETAMFMKGGHIRVDTKAPEVSSSIIVDTEAGRMYLVNHTAKTYMQQPMPQQLHGVATPADTARIRAMGLVPQVRSTGETRTILGFTATRVLSVQRVPYPSDPGMSMVTVTETWISKDPRLMKAYNASMQAAQRVMGPEAQALVEMISGDMQGVPLETTTIALQRAGNAAVDPVAILKAANPEGLMMRNHMEPVEVKLLALADSIFAVPVGYKKQN
jgi:hypothetical protein